MMTFDVVVNTNARTYLAGLLLARNYTSDKSVPTATLMEIPETDRPNCFLGRDVAFVESRGEHWLFPVVAVVDGEVKLSRSALEQAQKEAGEAGFKEVEVIAAGLLNDITEREIRAKAVPPPDSEDIPCRINMRQGDYVSWPSYGMMMHGRIEQIHVKGLVRPHDRHPGLLASENAPLATVRVYDKEGNGFVPTQRKMVRPAALLTKIGGLQSPKGSNVVKFRSKGKVGEVLIYSDIGEGMWGGISAKDFRTQLTELKGVTELNVRLNSGGGDVFEGSAIYNTLKEFEAHKIVHIDGVAASIATVIACAGDVIKMAETAQYMIHNSWTIAMGNKDDLAKMIKRLESTDELMRNVYAKRTGQSGKDLAKMMDEETWFTPDEAKQYGFVDEVTEPSKTSACAHRPWFTKAPLGLNEDLGAAERSQRPFLTARGRSHAAGR
jgi:ATP-dependent Clp protease, protease subunit